MSFFHGDVSVMIKFNAAKLLNVATCRHFSSNSNTIHVSMLCMCMAARISCKFDGHLFAI